MSKVAHALGKDWCGGIVLYQGDEIKKMLSVIGYPPFLIKSAFFR